MHTSHYGGNLLTYFDHLITYLRRLRWLFIARKVGFVDASDARRAPRHAAALHTGGHVRRSHSWQEALVRAHCGDGDGGGGGGALYDEAEE